MPLKIIPANEAQCDLLALGECMIRLSPPGHQRIELTPVFEAYAGGGEYNVAYALARYGMRTGFVSRLVDNPLGHFIRNHAKASGMDLTDVVWVPYDGSGRADRIGLNFTEVGMGVRASVTLYDRGHTAIAHMQPADVDWKKLFERRKTRWFHTGGILTALSESCAEVAREAMKAAHDSGAIVSYDLNYRPSLWKSIGGQKRAQEVNREIARHVDVMIGNEEDFTACLGFHVEGADENLLHIDVTAFKQMIGTAVKAFPNFKATATTLRAAKTATINDWAAIAWCDGKFFESRQYPDLEILDRVGGGDSFASGFIYGMMTTGDPQKAVDYGAAHGALAMTTPGDTSMADKGEVEKLMKGGGARVQR